ncbi:MAG TPA: transcriptional repressor [Acidimicrobiia bacterium]|nr:transcriptional repressor [Acidimicrobiia bacterium]
MAAGQSDRIEEILSRFTAAGGRRTASRQAIVEAVVGAGSHLTAEQIASEVQARFPSVNLSTVYRTLDALEELRVVDHVHLGHGRAVYHLSDEAHQHLFCERCERVQEVPISKLKPLFGMLEDEYGFGLDRRHFALVGYCRSCRP